MDITTEARRTARLINAHIARVQRGEHVSGGKLLIALDGRDAEWASRGQTHSSTAPAERRAWMLNGRILRVTERSVQHWIDTDGAEQFDPSLV